MHPYQNVLDLKLKLLHVSELQVNYVYRWKNNPKLRQNEVQV